MFKISVSFTFCFVCLLGLSTCSQPLQNDSEGIVLNTVMLYKANGEPSFIYYHKLWFKDSCIIEKITGVNINTDTANVTTMSYPVMWYTYTNPAAKTEYDYSSFSDTAKLLNKTTMQDSALKHKAGWHLYSSLYPIIIGDPIFLSDTVIEKVVYKKAKFNFSGQDPEKIFKIGYFRCDMGNHLFSLEKKYTRKTGCILIKYYDYRGKDKTLFGSTEVNFLSDKLTDEERRVFDAWGKKAGKNPAITEH